MPVQLRKITQNDLEKIMNWRMMPEVTRYMYTDPVLNMKSQRKWFEMVKTSDDSKYWIIQVDGTDIGLINLVDIDRTNKRCCWAYYIADTSFRGRGLGRILECNMYDYVFYKLGLNKLWCEVFTFNEKVIALHQKYGSEIEGTLRQHIYKNNSFYDIVRMGITKDKWDNIRYQYEYEKVEIED